MSSTVEGEVLSFLQGGRVRSDDDNEDGSNAGYGLSCTSGYEERLTSSASVSQLQSRVRFLPFLHRPSSSASQPTSIPPCGELLCHSTSGDSDAYLGH